MAQLAREPHEVHAPAVGEPAASDIREADGQPQRDRQVQSGQHLSVAALREVVEPLWIVEGEDVGEHSRGRERQREPEAGCNARPTLP